MGSGALAAAPATLCRLWVTEPLAAAQLECLAEALPHTELVVGYGRAETMPYVAAAHAPDDGSLVAHCIGRPLLNTRVYVLDGYKDAVPVGVPGELHVSGSCLAHGYLEFPALTAERFVPNPYFDLYTDDAQYSRMFRTGDLAVRLGDGSLVYLGPMDQQTYLRGFKIDLSEVEAGILACAGVEAAVAAISQDLTGAQRLVAYVTPKGLDTAALAAMLADQLPPHMMPGALITLDEMPLLFVGNAVDRGALPLPDWSAAAVDAVVAPVNGLEAQLQAIFQDVLGVEPVSTHADFFVLGGTDDKAATAMARVRKATGVAVPTLVLYRSPTVVALAETLAGMPRALAGAIPRAPFTPAQKAAGVPCPTVMETYGTAALVDPEAAGRAIIPVGLRLGGELDVTALHAALAALVERHEPLRTRFVLRNGQVLQAVAPAGDKRTQVHVRQEPAPTGGAAALMARLQAELESPFELFGEAGLVRALLLSASSSEHTLLLCIHHAVFDGWSVGVMMAELPAAYSALAAERVPQLQPLAASFVDFAMWERGRLEEGGPLASQLAYWKQQLAGALTGPSLRGDLPGTPGPTSKGGLVPMVLPGDLVRSLRSLAAACGATLFVVVLAAWKVLMAANSGSGDVTNTSTVAGRNAPELENLMGCFITQVVLRCDVGGAGLLLRELLGRVKATVMGAVANAEVPMERALAAAGVPEDLWARAATRCVVHDEGFFKVSDSMGGFEVERVDVYPKDFVIGEMLLSVELIETKGALAGNLAFNREMFTEASAKRITGQLQDLLSTMAQSGPDAVVDSLPLTSEIVRRMRSSATNTSLGAHMSTLASRHSALLLQPSAPGPAAPSGEPRKLDRGMHRAATGLDASALARALRSPASSSALGAGLSRLGTAAPRMARQYTRGLSVRFADSTSLDSPTAGGRAPAWASPASTAELAATGRDGGRGATCGSPALTAELGSGGRSGVEAGGGPRRGYSRLPSMRRRPMPGLAEGHEADAEGGAPRPAAGAGAAARADGASGVPAVRRFSLADSFKLTRGGSVFDIGPFGGEPMEAPSPFSPFEPSPFEVGAPPASAPPEVEDGDAFDVDTKALRQRTWGRMLSGRRHSSTRPGLPVAPRRDTRGV